ncbi:MAG: ribosomal-processing cysteine protease Prp [Lachnospiraceae bacterium]|nr:ribosomal-processing cysteine protease Prp [Lachnospiraceae bacterium]
MIEIIFKAKEYKITVTGHADSAEKGHDLVCAAVSTLFYTMGEALFQSAELLEEAPVFKDSEDEEEKVISCKPKKDAEGTIARSFWTILIGMEAIAASNPKNVKFIVRG